MNDYDYYSGLLVMDRINDLAIRKFGTLSKFSKALGLSRSWFYVKLDNGTAVRIKKINEIAKALDISIKYLIDGGDAQPYTGHIDIAKIGELSFPRVYNSLAVLRSKVKRGLTDNINLGTLFELMNVTQKDINFFISEDK